MALRDPVYRRLFPEVERFMTTSQRNLALERAGVYRFWLAGFLGLMLASCLLIGPLAALSAVFPSLVRLIDGPAPALVQWAVGLGAGFGSMFYLRGDVRRSLRKQLNDLAIPTCLGCGYDLTGNETRICPECGRRIKP